MLTASRVIAGFLLATVVALLCAAALFRQLPADPKDAMSAAGMLLVVAWPLLVIAAVMPARVRTSLSMIGAVGLAALLLGWGLP
jgi:hypothetical protein